MKVLFVGDIFGRPGRAAVQRFVPELRRRHEIDLAIGNAENVAGGSGVTPDLADELLASGLDLLTSGNHIWSKREINAYLDRPNGKLLRPANYPDGAPGRGHALVEDARGRTLGVVNLEGRVFMKSLECPFRTGDRLVAGLRERTPLILVDMHCEATSEKGSIGWYFDGRVSAVLGTHTHIQTADARILPGGTAFQTDVGMCGPWNSVIGVKPDAAIERFLTARHSPFETADGPAVLQGAILDLDDHTGRARSIVSVRETLAS